MKSLEGTDESSLSDGTAKLFISAAIGQHHLHKSIFRLFSERYKHTLGTQEDRGTDKPCGDSAHNVPRCEHLDRSREGYAAPRPVRPSARQCDCPRTWLRDCSSDHLRSRCRYCWCCSPSHDNHAQQQVDNRREYHRVVHKYDSRDRTRSPWRDDCASASRW